MPDLTDPQILVLTRLREYERDDFGVPVKRVRHLPCLPTLCDLPVTKVNGTLRTLASAGLTDSVQHPNVPQVTLHYTTPAGQAELTRRGLARFPLEFTSTVWRSASLPACVTDPAPGAPLGDLRQAREAVEAARASLWTLADMVMPGFRAAYEQQPFTTAPQPPARPLDATEAARTAEQAATRIEGDHPAIAATPDWGMRHRPLIDELRAITTGAVPYSTVDRLFGWDQDLLSLNERIGMQLAFAEPGMSGSPLTIII